MPQRLKWGIICPCYQNKILVAFRIWGAKEPITPMPAMLLSWNKIGLPLDWTPVSSPVKMAGMPRVNRNRRRSDSMIEVQQLLSPKKPIKIFKFAIEVRREKNLLLNLFFTLPKMRSVP